MAADADTQRRPSQSTIRRECAIELSRHHNVEGPVLAHTREQPYVCLTCQSRFQKVA